MKQLSSNNMPTILTVFGITGDLAAKKIIPSLWHLFSSGRLPKQISVISFSRRALSESEFKELIQKAIKKHSQSFFKAFSYQQGTFEDKTAFDALLSIISKTESSWGVCANKLFYLAVPPSSYEPIFKNLAAVKLNLPCGGKLGWSRILIENNWDNTTIDRIDLRLHEKIGVEERGSFYDSVGALRDVGQNHLLSMLATLTMEYPLNMSVDGTRKSRASIVETLSPWTHEGIKKNTYRAQYGGYKKIKGVAQDSKTETYFALQTELTHPKWRGIPIFMEAGKRMKEARKEIVLTLKHPRICYLCEVGKHTPNRIIFRLDPTDEIVIHFWTKKPGLERILEERTFSFFLYEKETKVQYVEEYAKVLYHAINGNQSLFVSNDEVEAEWEFTDPIIEGWEKGLVPLLEYKTDTTPTFELLVQANLH